MKLVSFEELDEGATYESVRRTITEADIVGFAGISGDFNPLHIDDEFGRNETPFGSRIAHGLLVTSIGTGLHSELINWHVLALLGCSRKFVNAVRPGDTVYAEYRVNGKRESASRPDCGIVRIGVRIVNSDNTVVQEGEDVLLMARSSRAALD